MSHTEAEELVWVSNGQAAEMTASGLEGMDVWQYGVILYRFFNDERDCERRDGCYKSPSGSYAKHF